MILALHTQPHTTQPLPPTQPNKANLGIVNRSHNNITLTGNRSVGDNHGNSRKEEQTQERDNIAKAAV
jgi:hypothetical protein